MSLPEDTRYTAEEVSALESMYAIQYGEDFFRRKMKIIAERSHRPEVGRALGEDLHLRLDNMGNPEMTQRKRNVLVRFCADGVMFQYKPGQYNSPIGNAASAVTTYTDYEFSYQSISGSRNLLPKKRQALVEEKDLSVHGQTLTIDNCRVCRQYKETLHEIQQLHSQLSTENNEFVSSLQLTPINPEAENDLWVVPYGKEANLTFLFEPIAGIWEKVKKARGWKRREEEDYTDE